MNFVPKTAEGVARPCLVIEPSHGWVNFGLAESWRYRELFFALVWRELAVRYKQTALGVTWALLQPLAMMAVFTIFLGKMVKMPSDGMPYSLFVLAGLLPWTLVARGMGEAATAFAANERLITKVYFPRLLLPAAVVTAAGVDAAIALALALVILGFLGIHITLAVFAAPVILATGMVLALGLGWGLSAIDVRYRDVRYALPFMTQLWFFASPIAYPISLVSESWRWVFGLNPLCGLIEAMRWSLLGAAPHLGVMAVSMLVIAVLFVAGLYLFRTCERDLVDRL